MDQRKGLKVIACSSKQQLTTFTFKIDPISPDKSDIYQDSCLKCPSGRHSLSKQKKQITITSYQSSKNSYKAHSIQSSTKNDTLTLEKSYSDRKFQQVLLVLYLLEVNQWIIDIVDRNRTYACHYIHFLLPYLFVVLEVKTIHKDHDHNYLDKIYAFVLKKLNQSAIQSQLKSADPQSYLSFVLSARNSERLQVLIMLRTFMVEQKESIMKVCPYYYNFFVMVCNKEIIFGTSKQPLLPYTVKQYKIKRYPFYTKNDIRKEISLLEQALVKEYQSPDIC